MHFAGRCVVVTGAASGIGLEARAISRRGARVSLWLIAAGRARTRLVRGRETITWRCRWTRRTKGVARWLTESRARGADWINAGVEHRAADIVDEQVDAIQCQCRQTSCQIVRAIVDRRIDTRRIAQPYAFRRTARYGDNARARYAGELSGNRADRHCRIRSDSYTLTD